MDISLSLDFTPRGASGGGPITPDNGDFILPAQVFSFTNAASLVTGFDELAVEVFE